MWQRLRFIHKFRLFTITKHSIISRLWFKFDHEKTIGEEEEEGSTTTVSAERVHSWHLTRTLARRRYQLRSRYLACAHRWEFIIIITLILWKRIRISEEFRHVKKESEVSQRPMFEVTYLGKSSALYKPEVNILLLKLNRLERPQLFTWLYQNQMTANVLYGRDYLLTNSIQSQVWNYIRCLLKFFKKTWGAGILNHNYCGPSGVSFSENDCVYADGIFLSNWRNFPRRHIQ